MESQIMKNPKNQTMKKSATTIIAKNIKYISIFSQLSFLLIGNGFEVQTFESPTSMLENFRLGSYDLLLVDIKMRNGWL
jgi:DNA-binding NtrC family response regulator